MIWTILTVLLVAVCGLFLLGGRFWAGRKSYGEAQETEFRLWSGLWKKDDSNPSK